MGDDVLHRVVLLSRAEGWSSRIVGARSGRKMRYGQLKFPPKGIWGSLVGLIYEGDARLRFITHFIMRSFGF